jgi:NADPH:quinone reductase-like Zn-dependent oxidoreductase
VHRRPAAGARTAGQTGWGSGRDAYASRARGLRFVEVAVEPDHAGLDALTALVEVEEGALRPYGARTYALRDVAKAHEAVESGSTRGRIVLTVV